MLLLQGKASINIKRMGYSIQTKTTRTYLPPSVLTRMPKLPRHSRAERVNGAPRECKTSFIICLYLFSCKFLIFLLKSAILSLTKTTQSDCNVFKYQFVE